MASGTEVRPRGGTHTADVAPGPGEGCLPRPHPSSPRGAAFMPTLRGRLSKRQHRQAVLKAGSQASSTRNLSHILTCTTEFTKRARGRRLPLPRVRVVRGLGLVAADTKGSAACCPRLS